MSASRSAVFAAAIAASLSSVAAQEAEESQETAETPDAATLEQRGVTIGAVNLTIDNVFNTDDPEEDKRIYRWANRAHRTTRPGVIEDILLFNPGEPLSQQLLEESARLLRDRGFVAEAAITTSNFNAATNTADVDVWVRDAWSLEPDLKLSRGGGENEYGLGLVEDNLFGLGKSMTLSYSSDVDRDQRLFSFTDENVFGSRKQIDVSLADMSDGRRFAFATGRPFYALDTRWSVVTEMLNDQRIDPIYNLGEITDKFRHDTRQLTIQGGRSKGLVDGITRRWIAGVTFDEHEFQPHADFGPPQLLPDDRRLIYPWAGVQIIGDDFRQVTELNDIGRTEDIALGLNFFMRVGFASPQFDSDRRAVLFDLTANRGWEPRGPGSLFLFSASATTRVERGDSRNTVVALNGRYMQRNFGNELFLASLTTVMGNRLDAENQILLGGDNGLRGYPLRYQSGESSALLSLEQRFYTDWYPFRLIRVGYAFFFDAGRVWGEDPRGTANLGTMYDVGVGLRLTSPRSSGRSVVHIDLAIPINAPAGIDDVQIVIEKKATF